MSGLYKNPKTPINSLGTVSVRDTKVYGSNFSVYGVGGYMEVYNFTDENK